MGRTCMDMLRTIQKPGQTRLACRLYYLLLGGQRFWKSPRLFPEFLPVGAQKILCLKDLSRLQRPEGIGVPNFQKRVYEMIWGTNPECVLTGITKILAEGGGESLKTGLESQRAFHVRGLDLPKSDKNVVSWQKIVILIN